RPKRSRRIVAGGRLDADDAAAGRQGARGERRAGEQPTAPTGREEIVERPDLLDELTRRSTLTGDDVRMIVRRDERQAALAGQPSSDRFAILMLSVVLDDLAAAPFRSAPLDRRRIGLHHDDPRDVEELPGH